MKKIIILCLILGNLLLFNGGCNQSSEKSSDYSSSKINRISEKMKNIINKETKLDYSNEKSMTESIKKITDKLNKEQIELFSLALRQVGFKNVNIFNDSKQIIEAKQKLNLNGKTYSEIMSEYKIEKIKNLEAEINTKKEDIIKIKEQINNINSNIELANENQKKLNQFKISYIKYEWIDYEMGFYKQKKPSISLKGKNNLDKAISRVYINASVKTKGRSVPWVKDSFNFKIKGGLEPGEEKDWSFYLNEFSDWADVPKDAKDLIVEYSVYQLDDQNGEKLYDSAISDYDIENLEKYKKNIIELEKKLPSLIKELEELKNKNFSI